MHATTQAAVAAALSSVAGVLGLPAQATPPPAAPQTRKPPAYQALRQNEDWSVLADEARTGVDAIKYLPLRDDRAVWLSLGGEARLRGEAWDGFRFGNPPSAPASDVFVLSRLRLHADLHLGPHLRTFVEGITAWATDRDLVGGRRSSDVDAVDLAQAFLDVKVPLFDGCSFTLRPGRQQLLLGRQRLVSPLPWPNALRAWDGVAAIVEDRAFTATAFLTQFAPAQKYHFNAVNRAVDLGGLHATWRPGEAHPGFDAYGYWLHRDLATFNGTTGDEARYTLGLRVWRPPSARQFDYDAEVAWQTGQQARNDIDAGMVAAQVGHTFAAPWSPRTWLGLDYASGDDNSGGDVQTFDQLFPLGHAYLGYIDIIGRQNIVDASGGLELRVGESVKTALDAHAFWLADRADALYDATGGVVRVGGTARSNFVGVELDWTANWQVDRHLGVLLGVSYFAAGAMIEQTGPSDDTLFAYAQAALVF